METTKAGKISNHIAMCRKCRGEGKIIIPGAKIMHNLYEKDEETICDLCKGSGLVHVKTEHIVKVTVSAIPALVSKSKV